MRIEEVRKIVAESMNEHVQSVRDSRMRIAVLRLAQIVEAQDARLAALEAARAPHGPPLEGTGPLPLERKGA